MFKKVLIANRGEIAVRVARTLREMDVVAVAVYSDADRAAEHLWWADEAYPLEGSAAAETYLRGDRIIKIAKACGAEAIHPGYGFLSENADFAQAVADAGLVFIGPKPETIRAVGDKVAARQTLSAAGVPVVPGWSGDGTAQLADYQRAAGEVGYPVLIKAAAGGGGKGMRLVEGESQLGPAIEAAQREAGSAFGDSRVFVEKYITSPRHVEFQIFGDNAGNLVHLFERECSIQRRYQKIIEESPSPALTPKLRKKMGDAAVKAAKAMGYSGAGTVELILDESGAFYFLEINARLQVEHPVTEMVTGHDLVRAQIEEAAGGSLPFSQKELTQMGHAIECRICAEDPARQYLPSTGRIEHFVPPLGANVRVDSGVGAGSVVGVHYDPLLAKLIVWGRDRPEALSRMAAALERFVILGVTTNLGLLRAVIDHPDFAAGNIDTGFLSRNGLAQAVSSPPDEAIVAAAMAVGMNNRRGAASDSGNRESVSPWRNGGSWRAV